MLRRLISRSILVLANMLKKTNRLTKDKEFDKVFKMGRSAYDYNLGIKSIDNDLGVVRLGILVSNKVSKKATERNIIKRRIREIFRLKLDEIKNGQDFIIIATPAAKGKEYKILEESINKNLKKIGALKN